MDLFKLLVKIGADSSEADAAIDDVGKKTSNLGSKIKSGLGTAAKAVGAAVAVAGTAVAALTKSAVANYAEYEQLVGGVDTLFKNSNKTVMRYAAQAYKTAGLSANQYMEQVTSFSASLLQSLGGDTEKAAEVANRAVIDMADNANKMGTAMESIQNAYQGFAKQNYTMLDNLKLGYGGTKEEMERLIADAAQMTEEQAALNITVDEGSLSFGNIVNAISVMQKHLDIAGTTSKEAATTIQGSVASMKSAWQNLLTGISDDSQNFGVLVDNFVDSLETAAHNVVPRIETALKGVARLVSEIAPKIVEELPGIVNDLIPGLIDAAITVVATAVQTIPETLRPLLDVIPPLILDLVPQILELLPEIIDSGMQVISSLALGISEGIPNLISTFVSAIPQMAQSFIANLDPLLDAALAIITALADGILQALPELLSALPDIITGIVQFIVGAIPKIIRAVTQIVRGIVQALPQIISELVAAIPEIISGILGAVLDSLPDIIEALLELVISIVDELPTIITSIIEAIPELINGIINAIVDNIDKFIEAGIKIFVALVAALPDIISGIVSAIPEIISAIIDAIGSFAGNIVEAGKNLIVKMGEGIDSAWDDVHERVEQGIARLVTSIVEFFTKTIPEKWAEFKQNAKEKISDIKEWFSDLPGEMLEIGENIVSGIWDGITGMWGWLKEKVSGFVGNIVDGVKENLGIHSPSKVFAGIGGFMAEGLGEGWDDKFGKIRSDIESSLEFNSTVAVDTAKQPDTAMYFNVVSPDGKSLARFVAPYMGAQLQLVGG